MTLHVRLKLAYLKQEQMIREMICTYPKIEGGRRCWRPRGVKEITRIPNHVGRSCPEVVLSWVSEASFLNEDVELANAPKLDDETLPVVLESPLPAEQDPMMVDLTDQVKEDVTTLQTMPPTAVDEENIPPTRMRVPISQQGLPKLINE
ncbi:UNVERIFIED_CONTAM: hypothetical protein Slati_2656500 [Sesamum latifolium]|uniref:Uncharacterized protein n=1 Tax=Sesamum latifolium TaxID=2727402 RepID=A0AAW2VV80_9LAMI